MKRRDVYETEGSEECIQNFSGIWKGIDYLEDLN
jgi:hypothetical protein